MPQKNTGKHRRETPQHREHGRTRRDTDFCLTSLTTPARRSAAPRCVVRGYGPLDARAKRGTGYTRSTEASRDRSSGGLHLRISRRLRRRPPAGASSGPQRDTIRVSGCVLPCCSVAVSCGEWRWNPLNIRPTRADPVNRYDHDDRRCQARRHVSEQKYFVAEPLPAVNAFAGTTNTPQMGSRTRGTLCGDALSRR
jgi:hypothetical protein